ncbi:hypothetical protein [Acidithiobacillus sp. AMEEHan]|nr:hypothetical protein [Acidithiobacillus sp. AMEEHan]
MSKVLHSLQGLPAQIIDLHLQEPRLEEVFTDLLQEARGNG